MQTYFGQIRHFNVFYNARYLPFKTNNAYAKFGGGGGKEGALWEMWKWRVGFIKMITQ